MSDAFGRLSGALQYQIVNGLGFTSLRPVQEQAIEPILDGENCVVLAPTAGGKTEAAFFPLLSAMDSEDWRPVSVLYVAPIRALLNNQEPRLERYAELIGRRAFKWHGDVSTSERGRFIAEPADILLTTPESLEAMLMSRRVPASRLFRDLKAVVIDEVHAFVGDDRGTHLAAVLERLARICGQDVQRIGLSATVGNPEAILEWAAGSSSRGGRIVRPVGESAVEVLSLDYVGSMANAAKVIARLHPGQKRLVFADSRRRVEELGASLRGLGVTTYVTHSSLSLDERTQAEQAFAEGRDCVIVSTSALELGIDVGDLDHVLQIDAPHSVAGFLQRMGRTGRRPGTQPNFTFLATDEDAAVRAAALLRLHKRGFIEALKVRRRAYHLVAHQLMALSIQQQGVASSDWWAWIAPAVPFSAISPEDRERLVEHMLARDVIAEVDGRFVLGERGEELYGRRHFAELYSVFYSPRLMAVLHGTREIGTIDADFALSEEPGRLTFVLGARSWRAMHVDWNHGLVHVEPVDDARQARWSGRPRFSSYEYAQSIKDVLLSEDLDAEWSERARTAITRARAEHLEHVGDADLVQAPDGYEWWTYAGGAANLLLARVLESMLGGRASMNNLAVRLREEAGKSEAAIREALRELRDAGRPNQEDAERFALGTNRGRLSKFQPCLPEELESRFLADELLDVEGAVRVVNDVSVMGRGAD